MAKENTLEKTVKSALKGIPGAQALFDAGTEEMCYELANGKPVSLPCNIQLGSNDTNPALDLNEGVKYLQEKFALLGPYGTRNKPFKVTIVDCDSSVDEEKGYISLYVTVQRK